jgi:hypothetical protein
MDVCPIRSNAGSIPFPSYKSHRPIIADSMAAVPNPQFNGRASPCWLCSKPQGSIMVDCSQVHTSSRDPDAGVRFTMSDWLSALMVIATRFYPHLPVQEAWDKVTGELGCVPVTAHLSAQNCNVCWLFNIEGLSCSAGSWRTCFTAHLPTYSYYCRGMAGGC